MSKRYSVTACLMITWCLLILSVSAAKKTKKEPVQDKSHSAKRLSKSSNTTRDTNVKPGKADKSVGATRTSYADRKAQMKRKSAKYKKMYQKVRAETEREVQAMKEKLKRSQARTAAENEKAGGSVGASRPSYTERKAIEDRELAAFRKKHQQLIAASKKNQEEMEQKRKRFGERAAGRNAAARADAVPRAPRRPVRSEAAEARRKKLLKKAKADVKAYRKKRSERIAKKKAYQEKVKQEQLRDRRSTRHSKVDPRPYPDQIEDRANEYRRDQEKNRRWYEEGKIWYENNRGEVAIRYAAPGGASGMSELPALEARKRPKPSQ